MNKSILITLALFISFSCSKKYKPHFFSGKTVFSKPGRNDINDCDYLEKRRRRVEANSKNTAIVNSGKKDERTVPEKKKNTDSGEIKKHERERKFRNKEVASQPVPLRSEPSLSAKVARYFLLGLAAIAVVGLTIAVVTLILVFSFVIVAAAFTILGFVISALAWVFIQIYNSLRRRRKRRRRRKNNEEDDEKNE